MNQFFKRHFFPKYQFSIRLIFSHKEIIVSSLSQRRWICFLLLVNLKLTSCARASSISVCKFLLFIRSISYSVHYNFFIIVFFSFKNNKLICDNVMNKSVLYKSVINVCLKFTPGRK